MKSGIDFFPLDVHLDEKFELIEAEYGLTGFAVVVKLLQRIYGGQGYYCEWTNEVALLFSRLCGVGGNVVSEIVEASVKRGIFDRVLYDKYGILTSSGIQRRYFEAVSRRVSVTVEKRYLLVNCAANFKNVRISGKNVDRNAENVNRNKQSKVEYSKVKDSRVKESTDSPDKPAKHKFGEYENVLLTDREYCELYKLYPDIKERIERLSEYIASKGARYKSHYATIRSWARKDEGNKPESTTNPFLKIYMEEK